MIPFLSLQTQYRPHNFSHHLCPRITLSLRKGKLMSDENGKRFGGLSPSEAASRRWEKQRERELQELVHEHDPKKPEPDKRLKMLSALAEEAQKGSPSAFRAWKELSEEITAESHAAYGDAGVWETITAAERKFLLNLLSLGDGQPAGTVLAEIVSTGDGIEVYVPETA